MGKEKILDLNGYKATPLERAVSIGVARSLAERMMINPMMALSEAFINGIAYTQKNFTQAERRRLEKDLAEVIRRIEYCDQMDAQRNGKEYAS